MVQENKLLNDLVERICDTNKLLQIFKETEKR